MNIAEDEFDGKSHVQIIDIFSSILLSFQEACQILAKRIKPFKDEDPSGTWTQWVPFLFDFCSCVLIYREMS